MKAVQKGFTLVELVVVIVILGILAATAIPRFVDVSVNARNSAALGVAGAIASGTAINAAARLAGNAGAVVLNGAEVCAAATLQPFVNGVTLTAAAPVNDSQFQITNNGAAGDCSLAANVTVTCRVTPNGVGVATQDVIVSCAR